MPRHHQKPKRRKGNDRCDVNDGLGFFCIDRKIFNHDIAKRTAPASRFEAWIYLVGYFTRGADNCSLKRGQFQVSERDMAKQLDWNQAKVHRFLDYLKESEMIELISEGATVNDAPVYRIVNYEKYNGIQKRKTSKTPIKPLSESRNESRNESPSESPNHIEQLPFTGMTESPSESPSESRNESPHIRKKQRETMLNKENNGEGECADAPLTLGEFGHVHLTPVQFTNLKLALNGYTDRYITRFDLWVQEAPLAKAHGVRRQDRDAYASIRAWYNRDHEEGKLGQRQQRESEAQAKQRRTKEASLAKFYGSVDGSIRSGLSPGNHDGNEGDVFERPLRSTARST